MKPEELEALLAEFRLLEDRIFVACGGCGGTKDINEMYARREELLAIPELNERITAKREEALKEALAEELVGKLGLACIRACRYFCSVEEVQQLVREGADVNVALSCCDPALSHPPLYVVWYILSEYNLALASNATRVNNAKEIIKILLNAGADCTIEIKGKPIIEHYRSMPAIFSVFEEAHKQDKRAFTTFSTAVIDRIGSESPASLIASDKYLLRSIGELAMRVPGSFFSSSARTPHDDEGSSKKTCLIG